PPRCSACDTVLKPDIVFFDEQIPVQALEWTEELINGAEILIVAGTSCEVIPASFIPQKVHMQGGKIIELNLFPVLDEMAEVVLKGKFTEKMEALLVELH
ncbi:MAG: RNA polymerase subunit sigma, partial [Desulfobulbaceae bacterium]|nr:RNA polymerase subunit sigma [Desulfobulbaceae bacterium]